MAKHFQQQEYLGLETLDEIAMKYAMLAAEKYDSETFGGDQLENKRARLWKQMGDRFGYYQTQEAIKRANETLKIVDFHGEN